MDPLDRQNKLDFVKQQMATYAGDKKESGEMTLILCPFHAEKTPSGAVTVGGNRYAPGFFHCFGCGKNASWDTLAPMVGLQPYKRGKPQERYAMDLMMRGPVAHHEDDEDGYEKGRFKFSQIPKAKLWRQIPTNLLLKLQGRMCVKWLEDYEKWGATRYLYFPVLVNGESRGYFRARLRKEKDLPSYLLAKSTPGSNWSKRWGLWPFDYSVELMHRINSKTMVLVEGQRDALRLLMNDIPAVCIFGTQSWSKHKPTLMELAGVERVVQLFDGDCAGIGATEKTEDDLRRLFDLKTVKLWAIKGSPYRKFAHLPEPSKAAKEAGVELWDPGNCPQWIIDKIKTRYL